MKTLMVFLGVLLGTTSLLGQTPPADGFDFPVDPSGTLGYVSTQDFLDLNACASGTKQVLHPGDDYARPGDSTGDSVYASAGGDIVFAKTGRNNGLGNLLVIQHYGTFPLPEGGTVTDPQTAYAHLDTIEPGITDTPPTQVTRGQPIGYVGGTGRTPPYTAHLHFELRKATLPTYDYFPCGKGRPHVEARYTDPSSFIDFNRPVAGCGSYAVLYSQLTHLYYLVQSTGEIRWVDPDPLAVSSGSVGFTGVSQAYGLLYDQCRDKLYTTDFQGLNLYEIDRDNGSVLDVKPMDYTFTQGPSLSRFHLVDMTLAPDGTIYALFNTTNAVYKSFLATLDLDTAEVEEVSRHGGRYDGFTYHPWSDTYYVSNRISPGGLGKIGVPGAASGGPRGPGSPGPGIWAMSPDLSSGDPADMLVAKSKSFPGPGSVRVRRFNLDTMSVSLGPSVAFIASDQISGRGMTIGPVP